MDGEEFRRNRKCKRAAAGGFLGVALDYSLPVSKFFTLSGEAFEGRALGLFNEPAGEAILPVGTPGEHGVETRGGWVQASFNLNPVWQMNIVYGLDVPNASQLRAGDRFRNQTYMSNVIYKFTPNVSFALEYRRLLTDFRNQRKPTNGVITSTSPPRIRSRAKFASRELPQ